MSNIYQYQPNPPSVSEDPPFSYLAGFYKHLSEDYQNASRILAWDNQTLGHMTALMAKDVKLSFGSTENTIARSSMALAALLNNQEKSNLKLVFNLPPTWENDEYEKGVLSFQFTKPSQFNQKKHPSIALVKPKNSVCGERLYSFYPLNDDFNQKIGSVVRNLAGQIDDKIGDHSVMMMAMVMNCWNSLSALNEPSVDIEGENNEIEGKKISPYIMSVALQRNKMCDKSPKPKL